MLKPEKAPYGAPSSAVNGAKINRKQRRAAQRRAKANKSAHRQKQTCIANFSKITPAAAQMLSEGTAHQKAEQFQEAERCYRKAIELDPGCALAYFSLGMLARQNGKNWAAYPFFKKAVGLDEENRAYWKAFGRCLADMGHHQAAAIAFDNAISQDQNDIDLLISAAWAHYHIDQPEKAIALFDRVLDLNPDSVVAMFGKGQQLFSLGKRDEAREWFERLLRVDPQFVEGYFRLIDLEPDTDRLPRLIKRAKRVAAKSDSEWKVARLKFGIAKAYRRLKDYDSAFESFLEGNAAMRKQYDFDRDQLVRSVDEHIAAFTPDVFERHAGNGSDTELPVFIVGMPRSGSTLTEQIISSHPDVEDAGEFYKLYATTLILTAQKDGQLQYPRDIARFDPESLKALGQDYLDVLCFGRSGLAARITDKQLSNFFNVGLIHILFPNARIIHCRRNPMDTGVSCFSQMFTSSEHLSFTFDLEDIGFYYRQYERLMAHWREVLPGRMYEIDYEKMVENQEEMSRTLIDHIGLDWNDACLEFYKSERSVRTASHSQVRRPVYTSSVEGWRKYEKYLRPLQDALAK